MSGIRIWAQPLGTDPVLKHVERFPTPRGGERLAEAVLTGQDSVKTIGWLVRNTAGVIVFAGSSGNIRTISPSDAEAALAAMEGTERKQAQALHQRLTSDELRSLLDEVGYSQSSFAREWGVTNRNVRRWTSEDLDVPIWVGNVLRMMRDHGIKPYEAGAPPAPPTSTP